MCGGGLFCEKIREPPRKIFRAQVRPRRVLAALHGNVWGKNAWGKPFWGGFRKGDRGVCKGIAASVKTDKRARRGALFAGMGSSWRAARRRRFRLRMRLSARRRRTARRRVAFHCAGVIAVSREVSLCPVPFWCCGNNAFRQIWKRHVTPCASSPRAFSCRLSGLRTAYGPMSVSTSGGAMRRRRLQKTGRRREYSPPSHAVDILLPSKVFSQRFDCLRIVGSSGGFPPQTNPRNFQPFTNSLFRQLSAIPQTL